MHGDPDSANGPSLSEQVDRRALLKLAGGGMVAAGLLAASPVFHDEVEAAFIPNNFHACVHVTNEDQYPYAMSALATIADNYDKAHALLIIDGSAVKALSSSDMVDQLKAANDKGADMAVATDALQINGIDPSTVPDFISAKNPGVIEVINAMVKGYHYYKP